MNVLHIGKDERGYDITIGSGLLGSAKKYMKLDRKVLVVTDSGVPSKYAEAIAAAAKEARIFTVPEGEGSKSIEIYAEVSRAMMEFGMGRRDCAVAVGGGVVGDLTGFCASTYMRGIDFYNVPTTVLSQVDSSIGGKCAINFDGIKNIIGSFYRPRAVLIDTDTLKTLPKRQVASGLCEALKMSLTSNAKLFRYFEENEITEKNIEYVITEALKIKAAVVEADEHEGGLRKILNLGHTLGHGIESVEGLCGLYHGECVALGMIPVVSESVKDRLIPVLEKLGLPTEWQGDLDAALEYTLHDKKCSGGSIDAIFVYQVGSFEIEKVTTQEFARRVKFALGK